MTAIRSVSAIRSAGCFSALNAANCINTAYTAPAAAAQINAIQRTCPLQRAIAAQREEIHPQVDQQIVFNAHLHSLFPPDVSSIWKFEAKI